MSLETTVKELAELIRNNSPKETNPYDATATVTRVDGNIAWVHIPGGIDETPVKMTVNASPGDTVQVRVSGGRAWITGNASAPPTDDTLANVANYTASTANVRAANAEQSAEHAETTAEGAAFTASEANTNATEANNAAAIALSAANSLGTTVAGGDMVSLSTTGALESGDADVDVDKFVEAVGSIEGVYSFTWDGSGWYLDSTEVDLYDYGISIDEEGQADLETGDVITATYEVVSGLSYFVDGAMADITALKEQVAANAGNIASNDTTLDILTQNLENIEQTLLEAASAIDTASEINARMTFGTVGGTPTLEIGKGGSDLVTRFTNEEIQFWDTGKKVASITGQQMVISNVRIYNDSGTSQLRLGDFVFEPRENGHLSLKWIGTASS